jgi:hypothetical protein
LKPGLKQQITIAMNTFPSALAAFARSSYEAVLRRFSSRHGLAVTCLLLISIGEVGTTASDIPPLSVPGVIAKSGEEFLLNFTNGQAPHGMLNPAPHRAPNNTLDTNGITPWSGLAFTNLWLRMPSMPGTNTLPLLSRSGRLPPGLYSAEPYSCLVLVPAPIDEGIFAPLPARVPIAGRIIKPPLRLVPKK